jgi:WXG100 family type VII secretion target
MSILLINEAFDKGKANVREAAGILRTDKNSIDDRVTSFTESGWTGIAADAFVEAWADWKLAATDVEEGLAAMADLLDAAQRDFNVQDQETQAALDSISARIIGRLG